MNKKTYIVEENQIRLKPDVEKLYHASMLHHEQMMAQQPTYPKSGDWSEYEIGQEISEDEVEISKRMVFHEGYYYCNCRICEGRFIGAKRQPACKECCETIVAIPKKKEVEEGVSAAQILTFILEKSDLQEIELVDGAFYWTDDKDGDQPMYEEDILKLYTQKLNSKS